MRDVMVERCRGRQIETKSAEGAAPASVFVGLDSPIPAPVRNVSSWPVSEQDLSEGHCWPVRFVVSALADPAVAVAPHDLVVPGAWLALLRNIACPAF